MQLMSYSDVTDEHWAAEYIEQLTDKGILFGTPEGNILPDNNITRAEIAAMISRTYDEEYVGSTLSFNDVQGHWAQKDIERLVDKRDNPYGRDAARNISPANICHSN